MSPHLSITIFKTLIKQIKVEIYKRTQVIHNGIINSLHAVRLARRMQQQILFGASFKKSRMYTPLILFTNFALFPRKIS